MPAVPPAPSPPPSPAGSTTKKRSSSSWDPQTDLPTSSASSSTDISPPARKRRRTHSHVTTVSFTIKREETRSPSLGVRLPQSHTDITPTYTLDSEAFSPIHTPPRTLHAPVPISPCKTERDSLDSTRLWAELESPYSLSMATDPDSCAHAAAMTQELIDGYLKTVESLIGAF
ncbi:hypothetical protein FB45DRAFT_914843 [Roridomyces roridus]|uniref:Uncharacterized protein n=1 Tax=Roridomyces roridus TaxID=1738132 RepID=A0AAD7BT69_9AGAR|nr:hypothetical protein FB45DRAFT_914843 [Roridomyces roridus]